MTWIEIEFNASWANTPGDGNAHRTARMLMKRFFVFMMYRLSLFSGNFSRALQRFVTWRLGQALASFPEASSGKAGYRERLRAVLAPVWLGRVFLEQCLKA